MIPKVLQKHIAERTNYSRRQAEELIRKGKVSVNNKIAEPGQKVAEEDVVRIGRKDLQKKTCPIYIKLNKPKGYTCTTRKFKNELNVFDLVDVKEKLFLVGRLDKDSRGLVILTNDGDWANKITHPSFRHEKEYRVKIKNQNAKIKENIEEKFLKGIDIGEGDGVVQAKKVEQINDNTFKIILTQGKKRQVRRMFKVLGLDVKDLKRIRVDGVNLGDLTEGKWEFLKESELEK